MKDFNKLKIVEQSSIEQWKLEQVIMENIKILNRIYLGFY